MRAGADLLAAVRAGKFSLVLRYRFAGIVPALWIENTLIASTMVVLIIFFEAIWNIDFFTRLATGKSLIGLSAYMFDPKIPLFIRALSCFHIGLPVLLLWALHRLGYDRRAFFCQTILALVVLPLSYLFSNPRENVNWVYGFGETAQRTLPAPIFLALVMLIYPIAIYLPAHLLFARIFDSSAS